MESKRKFNPVVISFPLGLVIGLITVAAAPGSGDAFPRFFFNATIWTLVLTVVLEVGYRVTHRG